MKYYRNNLGAYIEIEKESDHTFYALIESIKGHAGVKELVEEFNTFIQFLEQLELLDPKKQNMLKIFPEKNSYIICAVHADDPSSDGIAAVMEFKESVDKEKIVMLQTAIIENLYIKFRHGEKIEGKDAKIAVPQKSKGEQIIYKVKLRELAKYAIYADYFFIQQGAYYIKALPGVCLDDFLDKADIYETSLNRIEAKAFR